MISSTKNYILVHYSSLWVISLVGLLFGYWFAHHQLLLIAQDAPLSYPNNFFIITILQCYCTIITFYAFANLILGHLSRHRLEPLYISLSFTPLILVYANCPLVFVLPLILILQLALLIKICDQQNYRWLANRYGADTIALMLFFLLHLILTTRFSPLSWNASILASGNMYDEITNLAPIYRSYVLAKQFVFSTMDYSQWAGILNPPITLNSPLLQLITFIFNLPSISVAYYRIVLLTVTFIMFILGSFGFYLFLKYAAKLNYILAIFGGCLFFFSGTPLLGHMLNDDGTIFLSSYVVFPYALLFISLAFRDKNYYFACWAGIALAAQFFLMTPHPEGVIYSALFYALYTAGLMIFSRDLSIRLKFSLAITSFGTFAILSAYTVVPIMIDEMTHQMHTVAHTLDIAANSFEFLKPYVILFVIYAPLSLLVRSLQKQLSPVYLSLLMLAAALLGLISLSMHPEFTKFLIHELHIGLHIWYPWRIGMYFYASVFAIAMIALQAIAQVFSSMMLKRYRRISIISIPLIVFCFPYFPLATSSSSALEDNPHFCPYYITIQSLLTNYPLIANDKANISYIKHRLSKFEKAAAPAGFVRTDFNPIKTHTFNIFDSSSVAAVELKNPSLPVPGMTFPTFVGTQYYKEYSAILNKFKLDKITSARSEAVILDVAQATYPVVDNYYLDKNVNCITPLYKWKTICPRRILRYNTSGLYDHIPNKFSLILVAIADPVNAWLSGAAPGLFFVNESTTMDTRFVTGVPLLTALYVLPKYDFAHLGSYSSIGAWDYFNSHSFVDPITRQVLNIAGVDVFTVTLADLKHTHMPDTTVLPSGMNKMFDYGLKSFINNKSYGMAYLANHITYQNPTEINNYEKIIKQYFANSINPSLFTQITNLLYQKLMQLKNKHDVIIEATDPQDDFQQINTHGSVTIKGIIGERAFFITHCLQKKCTFIFNIADTKGWYAYVNGIHSTIQRANFAFMSTSVPQGDAKVWFIYAPYSQLITYFISILSLIAMVFYGSRRNRLKVYD